MSFDWFHYDFNVRIVLFGCSSTQQGSVIHARQGRRKLAGMQTESYCSFRFLATRLLAVTQKMKHKQDAGTTENKTVDPEAGI